MTSNNYPKDIRGRRFGKLVVIGTNADRSIKRHPKWLCKCDCGNEKLVFSHYLFNGHTKSCGCLGKESRQKAPGEAGLNAAYKSYKKNAEIRNLTWSLDKQQFKDITSKNCFYCEAKPKNVADKRLSENGRYVYNGIDRVDNTQGYTIGNCVPCCYKCNVEKKAYSIKNMIKCLEFLGYNIGIGI